MANPVTRSSKRSSQGVFSQRGLRKASASDTVLIGLGGSTGIADGVYLKGSEKVGCALIPSQIILTRKAHEFDDIVKETNIMGLDALRERLDIIDERILSLLSERAKVIMQVADFKRHHNIPIYVPEREMSIIERLRGANPGPLPGDTVERIYRNILEEMRKFESEHFPH